MLISILDKWTWDPLILLFLVITLFWYLRGIRVIYRRQGRGRRLFGRTTAFLAGLCSIFIALISPVAALSDLLFSAHMVQHILLIVVSAPLLVLGYPLAPFLLALPRAARYSLGHWWANNPGHLRSAWRWTSQPVRVWGITTLVFWAWHLPWFYRAAVEHEALHAFEHTSFLLTAMLFWWTVLHHYGERPKHAGWGVVYLITFTIQGSLLSALFILWPTPWYPLYAATTARLGSTLLADQQLAGYVMGIPSGIVNFVAALLLLQDWQRALQKSARINGQLTIQNIRK